MVWILIIGIIISVVFLISKRVIKLLSPDNPYRKTLQYLFPLLEFTAWGGFIFWSIFVLYRNRFFYEPLVIALVIILTLLITWFFLKDLVAGVIFKAANNIRVNDRVRFNHTSGILKRLGIMTLKLENDAGELEIVNYSSILGKQITRINPGGLFKKFTLKIPHPGMSENQPSVERIKSIAWSSPWSSTRNEPLVTEKADQQGILFELTVYALNSGHAEMIRNQVLREISESAGSQDHFVNESLS